MKYPPRNIGMSAFNWRKLILQTDMKHPAKYLALYLSTYMNDHQDMAWPSLKRIEGETGLSHPTVLKWLNFLCEEGWLIKESGSRTESNRYHINVPKEVGKEITYVTSEEKVGREVTSNNNRITNTLSKGSKRFIEPTVDEVRVYCQERGNQVDPETFVDWNASKGWKVGNQPMKDWKAAVRTWEKREKRNGQHRGNTQTNHNGPQVRRVGGSIDTGHVFDG
jgi:hypothetical protein